MTFIQKNHDLDLPDWGPYSKNFVGVAHVANKERGLRFDLAVMPGYFRRQMVVPSEKWESGVHTWEAAPNLEYYSYRYEIAWKDEVYCDMSVSESGEDCRLIRCDYHNNTDVTQNLNLHLAANLNYPMTPTNMGYHDVPMDLVEPVLPAGAVIIDAADYDDLQFENTLPSHSNVESGFKRAEIRGSNLVSASGIGCDFGASVGDWVSYTIKPNTGEVFDDAVLVVRYSAVKNTRFKTCGDVEGELILPKTGEDFALAELSLGSISPQGLTIRLTSMMEQGVVIDSLVVVEKSVASEVKFQPQINDYTPEITRVGKHGVILKYKDSDSYYAIAWKHNTCWVRQILGSDLERSLRLFVPNTYMEMIEGDGKGHYLNPFISRIGVERHSSKVVYCQVSSGSKDKVLADINRFVDSNESQLESVYESARAKRVQQPTLPSGETYQFSQQRMAATEILNMVYPVYTRRQYIKHNAPGKWWDCLYTWDSGFIGMALLNYDVERAKQTLETYLVPEGDSHAAYINFGSPIPTQIYLLQEIFNQTSDLEYLKKVYGSAKQYYMYLAGRAPGSTTNNMQSNLIRTWDIFWETGGWDDYPAQKYTMGGALEQHTNHAEGDLRRTTVCATNSAYTIRAGRILRDAALSLGLKDDVLRYEEDIRQISEGLQTHSWDSDAQYFSYVLHDKDGKPYDKLRTPEGLNYNMGMDGIMPLIAGVCDEEQKQILLNRLKSFEHLRTPIGITLVDQQAPYYKHDGYCNGSVWMPHQWFFWKTALDLGDHELAQQIATTALNLWKREVESTYLCFEHFVVESERGAGWHQFSGLTSPVVNWFNAYHVLGKLTTGFDTWVEQQQFDTTNTGLEAIIRVSANSENSLILVNLDDSFEYQATWNGEAIAMDKLDSGTLEIRLPYSPESGHLVISKL